MPREKCLRITIDMTKGIAIETILLLLLGILVVGILVFMLYKYVFNPVLPLEMCRSKAISWCGLCKNAYPSFKCTDVNGDGKIEVNVDCFVPVGSDLSDCAKEHFTDVPSYCDGSKECCHNANNWCAAFIGVG